MHSQPTSDLWDGFDEKKRGGEVIPRMSPVIVPNTPQLCITVETISPLYIRAAVYINVAFAVGQVWGLVLTTGMLWPPYKNTIYEILLHCTDHSLSLCAAGSPSLCLSVSKTRILRE